MEPAAVVAQRAAIMEARARYERGEITFDTFRRALDALVLACDSGECQAILGALPTERAAALDALEPSPVPTSIAAERPDPQRKAIVAFMGQTKKLRRPWRLAPSTKTRAFMGEVKLDLGVAELPPRATMRITGIMATVVIYVPSNVRVSVRSTALLSDIKALGGEGASGVVAFGHEEHVPVGEPAAEIEIEVFALMANVKVLLADARSISVGELAREALRAVVEGVRRGLAAGPSGESPRPRIAGSVERMRRDE
jgi:cell wall-active antibiotic response 4TMS protein YvqF